MKKENITTNSLAHTKQVPHSVCTEVQTKGVF